LIPLPEDFIKRINAYSFWPENLIEAMNEDPPVSIRLNPLKNNSKDTNLESVPWNENGHYLPKRPIFTLDPLFHAGCYYPQEAGSMVIEFILNDLSISKKSTILDLCAAPGGKSTLISSWLEDDGFLVSNEIIANRNSILRENLTKWGAVNSVVTCNQPKHFQELPSFFDVVIVDAPCSGEGMFRKDPDSRNEWSLKNVDLCADRQKQIVCDVWDSLKENGYLIYSTCTLNKVENEDTIKWLSQELNAEILPLNLPTGSIKGREGVGIYFAPGLTKSEGFFISVLKKKDTNSLKIKKNKPTSKALLKNELTGLKDYVDLDVLTCIEFKGGVAGIHSAHFEFTQILQSKLYCTKIGMILGTLLPKKLEPHYELAFSTQLLDSVPRIELDEKKALLFLKGETFEIGNLSKGYYLVTYMNQGLGWINHLGNRFNNLYPKEWRIRMKID
jgi:16S rRNA C967 or C1407 C5-methylase (RsmB/RsmF family)/NOL1/NOP2/fmu family ribosome biogenesis protein